MIKDVPALVVEICKQLKEKTDIAVVGMSGGADSTLVSILCREALGAGNVVGVHMPYSATDASKFNSNSVNTANKLGIRQIWFPIQEPVDSLTKLFNQVIESGLSQINSGNMRSRMRMITLYTISHAEGKDRKKARVIGTGNLSEDYIGYDTKGGDALCDFFPIGQ